SRVARRETQRRARTHRMPNHRKALGVEVLLKLSPVDNVADVAVELFITSRETPLIQPMTGKVEGDDRVTGASQAAGQTADGRLVGGMTMSKHDERRPLLRRQRLDRDVIAGTRRHIDSQGCAVWQL